ncbi:MAG: nitroreductase family deazaflavin-dependent oxidoreductase [Actinomycetes bacterium]
MSADEVVDSPTEWVADHIRRYVGSRGEDGHIWRGVPTLLLTTKGRRSGLRRRTALIYGKVEDRYVIVASKGGHPSHPLWYENLVAEPLVDLQVGAEVFSAHALTVSNKETYDQLWKMMVLIWPGFEEYKLKTARQIPLVTLNPVF